MNVAIQQNNVVSNLIIKYENEKRTRQDGREDTCIQIATQFSLHPHIMKDLIVRHSTFIDITSRTDTSEQTILGDCTPRPSKYPEWAKSNLIYCHD